jgi:hypothetical protein
MKKKKNNGKKRKKGAKKRKKGDSEESSESRRLLDRGDSSSLLKVCLVSPTLPQETIEICEDMFF